MFNRLWRYWKHFKRIKRRAKILSTSQRGNSISKTKPSISRDETETMAGKNMSLPIASRSITSEIDKWLSLPPLNILRKKIFMKTCVVRDPIIHELDHKNVRKKNLREKCWEGAPWLYYCLWGLITRLLIYSIISN